jgi:hypothetical protein
MRGFDYASGRAVDRSLAQWSELLQEARKHGGFLREDRTLKETFIHRREGVHAPVIAEIYAINIRFKETK